MNEGAPIHRVDSAERHRVIERLGGILAAQPRVAFAFAFGSFTEDRPFHDIDVGVQIDDEAGGPAMPAAAALQTLEERLATAAGYAVDLVVLNGRPVTFLYHVYRGRVILARNEARLTSELEWTMRVYFDIAPVLQHATREAFGT
jgi:predicted nucleotidyltransferase